MHRELVQMYNHENVMCKWAKCVMYKQMQECKWVSEWGSRLECADEWVRMCECEYKCEWMNEMRVKYA